MNSVLNRNFQSFIALCEIYVIQKADHKKRKENALYKEENDDVDS